MKKYLFLMAGLGICASGVEAQESVDLTDEANRVSYAIGLNMGTSLKRQDIPVEKDALVEGLFSALGDSEPRLTQAEIQETLNAFRTKHQEMQAAKLKEEGEANRKKGEAFLAENGKKDGVVTLPSGLQYKIVEAGSGEKPGARDKVTVHYRGTLIDGTEFDSSYSRNEPATFPLNGVIKGWQEGLQLMSPGGHWEFYIPSELAYGSRGSRGGIGPDETLVFDVKLISVEKVAPVAPPKPRQPITSDIIKVPSKEELEKGAKIEILKPEDVEREIAAQKAKEAAESTSDK